jgi:hypothetical protein
MGSHAPEPTRLAIATVIATNSDAVMVNAAHARLDLDGRGLTRTHTLIDQITLFCAPAHSLQH